MRIIYDAPGQTCNRLWSYVASVAMCIAKHKKMIIIFHDETVEDFPSFLNCPFIYFPLWSIGKGKKWYTGLIWRIKFNYKNSWKIICDFWGFTNGWDTRFDAKYIIQTLPNLQKIFRPKEEIMQKAQATIDTLKRESDIVIGIHIRRGDYASWQNGRFYFGLDVYYKYMMQIKKSLVINALASLLVQMKTFPLTFLKIVNAYVMVMSHLGLYSICIHYPYAID